MKLVEGMGCVSNKLNWPLELASPNCTGKWTVLLCPVRQNRDALRAGRGQGEVC